MTDKKSGKLREISPDRIQRNDDNPRIFFREEEMDSLMASINRYGIQVPITVYESGNKFVLIDGERRWRCARKLNHKVIPAIVQARPTPLDNLLLMFNIHALREQWDFFTIANKLPDVQNRFRKEFGHAPNERELSEATGLTRGQIRRCMFLVDLPQRYRDELVKELALPKRLQKISEDLFIEMERALKTVRTRLPTVIDKPDRVRDALIGKFRTRTIKNVTDFRMISKIATSVKNLGVTETKAKQALSQIFSPDNEVGIAEIYADRFGLKYDEKRVIRSVASLSEYLEAFIQDGQRISPNSELRHALADLEKIIKQVLRG